jgi:hypothetical protein
MAGCTIFWCIIKVLALPVLSLQDPIECEEHKLNRVNGCGD